VGANEFQIFNNAPAAANVTEPFPIGQPPAVAVGAQAQNVVAAVIDAGYPEARLPLLSAR